MSHELEAINGKIPMVYFGAVPWHGLGNPLTEDERFDLKAARKKAQADWTAEKVSLMTCDTHEQVDYFAVRRKDNKKILGTVGPRYTILQNKDAFEWFTPFLETKEACLHTAGLLRGGSRIWVLAKLNRKPMEIAKDDRVEKFILLSHSHDGTLAVRVGFTPIRVVCANTLAMAHEDGVSQFIRCRHSANIKTNLENIRECMNVANQSFEATAEQYRALCRRDINDKDVRKFVQKVFELENDDFSTHMENVFGEINELIANGRGNDLPGVKDTWWAAYNGMTEYLSYSRGRSKENRLNSLWFGDSAQMNKRALEAALELAMAV